MGAELDISVGPSLYRPYYDMQAISKPPSLNSKDKFIYQLLSTRESRYLAIMSKISVLVPHAGHKPPSVVSESANASSSQK